jgi:hypothetical protein
VNLELVSNCNSRWGVQKYSLPKVELGISSEFEVMRMNESQSFQPDLSCFVFADLLSEFIEIQTINICFPNDRFRSGMIPYA